MPLTLRAALAALLTTMLLAFASAPAARPRPLGIAPPPVTVFAAASLQESLDAVAADWTARSGQRVIVSYGASSALARQILQGAPADMFISADVDWMDVLERAGYVDPASRIPVAGNRLVVVAPAASPPARLRITDAVAWQRALGPGGRLAIADVTSVPAGRYARQSLGYLHVWDAVAARLAPAESVRAALAYVARGETPLGIVYATDARAEPRVRVVAEIPRNTHATILYPAARVLRDGGDPTRATGFLGYLRSPAARARFGRAGFGAP